MIEFKSLSKVYGKKDNILTTLKNVNLKISTGASAAIINKSLGTLKKKTIDH